jgi:DNA uptake protein ComE-like DNA-binding protein
MARSRARAFATLIVLLAIAVVTVALVSLQSSAFRQAAAGREAVARVRAVWAARAGVEAAISGMEFHAEQAEKTSAFTLFDTLDTFASGRLQDAEFSVAHTHHASLRDGVEDPHAKVNVNRMSFDDLMELPGMSEDQADAILDWIDEDSIVRELGAEKGFYSQLPSPYEPRNGFIRSLAELELVAGVDPLDVRGEDWNLNGRLDPNENDGDASWPPDDQDDTLDAGWSEFLTTESVDISLAASGQPRLDLFDADERTLMQRVENLELLQARVIIDYARRDGVRLEDLISSPLQLLATTVPGLGAPPGAVVNMTPDQIADLLNETTILDPALGPIPGRVNINTVDRRTLDFVTAISAGLADQIIFARDSRPEGFVSIVDLLGIVPAPALTQLSFFIDVQSNAIVVSSRGRDVNTGIEVDMVATLHAGTLPITITELSVR